MGAHFVLEIFENVDLSRPVAWLLGHEGQGVSDALLNLATHRVVIPHAGAVESLNVAACAAVCFFEQLRQQQQA
jgi:TrmH family RNA methyltransferase